jgi:hypothetical protein
VIGNERNGAALLEEDSPGWKRWLVIGGFIVGAVTVIGVVYQGTCLASLEALLIGSR